MRHHLRKRRQFAVRKPFSVDVSSYAHIAFQFLRELVRHLIFAVRVEVQRGLNDIRDGSRFLQALPVADAVIRRQGSRASSEQGAGKRAGKPGKSRIFQKQVNSRLTLRSFFRHAVFAVVLYGIIKLVVFTVGDHVEQRICVLRNDLLGALRSGLFRNRKQSVLDPSLPERLRRAEKIVDSHHLCRRFNRAMKGSERERLAKSVPFFNGFDRPSASRGKPHPDQRAGFP